MINPRETPEPEAEVNHSIRLLHLEDDPRDAELIRLRLNADGLSCDIMWVNGKEAFESALDRETFDLVLSDYSLPDYDGFSALRRVREKQLALPVIVISGTLGEEEAVDCLKAGATDYVLKQRLQRLGTAVRRALAEKAEREKRLAVENALQASEERFRSIAEATHEWILELDAQGIYTFCSSAVESILGYTPEELIGRSALDYVYHHAKEDVAELLRSALAERRGWRDLVLRMRHKDGSMRWVDSNSLPLLDPQGEVIGYRGVTRDITERVEQQEKITRLNRIHVMLSDINSTIVRTRNREGLFAEACRIAVEDGRFRLVWIGLLDANGLDITPVARAGVDEGYLDNIRLTAREGEPDGCKMVVQAVREETAVVCNDIATDPQMARWRDEALQRGYRSVAMFPLFLERKVVGLFLLYAAEENFFDTGEIRLLTEIAGNISFALDHLEKEDRINYLAYYDALTELPNRTLFQDRLQQRTSAAHSDQKMFAVILLDLERFRIINETLGQHAGDELLRQVARRLQDGLHETDILARPSGNLFAIVTGRTDDGVALAQLVEQTLFHLHGQPFEVEGKELRVVAKAGIAVYPGDGEGAEILYRNAEAALEKAKRSGDRYLFYASEFNARVAERLTLENKLRRAVERGELVLHYQPKIELKKRRISGLEALMRWNDPDTGLLVPPLKFIPILEETGLILEAGRWALEQAVADFARWTGKGLQVPRIAVNVSPIQLRQKDFVATVERALGAGGGEGILELEITESLIMQDIETNIRKLQVVRDMGVAITVDDFGTGYSSLSYIARLPIGALKIDRAFIMNMTSNPDDLGIVSTIISLGHSLSLKVVAEGVETEEQANLLRLLKCDEFQGYLFSRPVPVEQIEILLQENKSPAKSPS